MGQSDFRSIEKTSTSTSHDKPENEAPEKREAAVGEYFFIGRDNLVTAASPPHYFVARSSSGEANSHNNLTEDAEERVPSADHQEDCIESRCSGPHVPNHDVPLHPTKCP